MISFFIYIIFLSNSTKKNYNLMLSYNNNKQWDKKFSNIFLAIKKIKINEIKNI